MKDNTKVGDITSFDGDVIINTIGVETGIYGGVCAAVVKNAKSEELKDIIKSAQEAYTVGSFFVTEGYKLQAKHILHLLPPHKKFDRDDEQIKECIRTILNECQFRGWYKVAIPLIATGANLYDKSIIDKLLIDMCTKYCEYYPKMNIIIYYGEEKTKSDNDKRLAAAKNSDGFYHSEEIMKMFEKGSKVFKSRIPRSKKGVKVFTKNYFGYEEYANRTSIIIDKKNLSTIEKYIKEYQKHRNEIRACTQEFDRSAKIYLGYGTKQRSCYDAGKDLYSKMNGGNHINKNNLLRIAFACEMTLEEAQAFLNYFGSAIAVPGVMVFDDTIRSLFKKRIYGVIEIQAALKSAAKNHPSENISKLFI